MPERIPQILESLEELTRNVVRVTLSAQRTSRVALGGAILALLGLGVAGFAIVQNRHLTARLAKLQSEADQAVCVSGNNYRRGDAELWHHIEDLTTASPQSETPAQAAQRARQTRQFNDYLAQHDKIVDCSKVNTSKSPQPLGSSRPQAAAPPLPNTTLGTTSVTTIERRLIQMSMPQPPETTSHSSPNTMPDSTTTTSTTRPPHPSTTTTTTTRTCTTLPVLGSCIIRHQGGEAYV